MTDEQNRTRFSSLSGDMRITAAPSPSFEFSAISATISIVAQSEPLSFLLVETGDFLIQEDGGRLIL